VTRVRWAGYDPLGLFFQAFAPTLGARSRVRLMQEPWVLWPYLQSFKSATP